MAPVASRCIRGGSSTTAALRPANPGDHARAALTPTAFEATKVTECAEGESGAFAEKVDGRGHSLRSGSMRRVS
jgi:hypothetical protein